MREKYDVVIVGCGVAGLYSAMQFPDDWKILMICKGEETLSNSSLAQGGVAAVLDLATDSYESHFNDTMVAGGFANNPESVKVLVEEGPGDVRKLMEYGVDFDKDAQGNIQKTLEGGHGKRRIMHHKDQTGYELVIKLLERVKERPNVELSDQSTVVTLERVENGFHLEVLQEEIRRTVYCNYCILATGGIGRIYKHTTNSAIATGDGIRLAYELGARVKNLSYIQFHPTAFANEGSECFLISEAVRGEGAYLLNCNKERFVSRYDERGELAPRDVVSHAIMLEQRRTGSKKFWLDISYKDRDFIYHRFPAISAHCKEKGYDMAEGPIPIYPCQHYLMGGIEVNLNSRTTVSRLYAIGECSNTGVHGKNRLASNSLLEALVFGRRAALDIQRHREKRRGADVAPETQELDFSGAPMPVGLRHEIREIMQRAYFVMPNMEAVHSGKKRVQEILNRLKTGGFAITKDYCEALSFATAALIILREVDEA